MLKIIPVTDVIAAINAPTLAAPHVTEEIWNAMSQSRFRRSSQSDLQGEPEQHYKRIIRNCVENGLPVHFVLIAFPWKLWRMPLKTDRKTADLGELAFLAQIKRLNESIRMKYPPGTKWTFLTEGEVYRELFGNVPMDEITNYIDGIKRFARLLGVEQVCEFIPLQQIYNSFVGFGEKIEEEVKMIEAEFCNGAIPEHFRSFFNTFYCSQDMRMVDPGTIRRIFNQKSAVGGELTNTEQQIVDELKSNAKSMMIRYLGINQAKHRVGTHGAIQDSFPDALYISITQKPGRYALCPIHQKTRLLPHHGVPVVRSDGRITIEWLDSVQHAASPACRPVYIEHDTEPLPFYYEECL